MNSLLKPIPQRETLGDHVFQQIKEMLLTGKVMPGELLSLRSTAEVLGVSMTPVRQAVYQLVADHALEVAPNRSVRVPTLSASQFREITTIRLEVEGFAVSQAVPRATPDLIKSLRTLNQTLSRQMDSGGASLSEAILLNKQLHFSLYAASDMPMLVKIIESLWLRIGPILNYDLRSGSARTRNKTAVAHHEAMIVAVERGDVAAARQALHDDIESAYQYITDQRYAELLS
ncbi:MAG: GntR family transcriptional regulator [Castellaniella sp.]|uniref:GntR family transcriptional regulator n=1 Tax=Castellaniella sp. TaxID=1955812 RepID=UPI001202AC80|nr:GntR family transcriptional regulator [Castellaniella sp.]TAN25464.1 MAG: GntR family transcriptional regulator [Castellaniella sp.]